MPNNSSPTTNGKLLKNSTCLLYAPGPLVAKAFEKKCSTRNRPMGMMPVSECSRRRKNEHPCPARNGATPPLTVVLVELGADAKPSLNSLEKITEPFIMLATNGPSQGRQFSRSSRVRRKARFSLRESDDGVLLRRNRAESVRQYRPIRMIEAGADFGRSCARVAVHGQLNVFS